MAIRNHTAFLPRCSGVTIVEILLVISVLAIVISFAVPGIDRATARAEVKAATENVQYSIDTARKLARMTEASVTLHADPPDGAGAQHVRLSGRGLGDALAAPDYQVPDSVRLVADHAAFTFDERGLTDNPGRMVLVSEANEAIFSELTVE